MAVASPCLPRAGNPLVVVVHGGGASNISKDRRERVCQGVVRAATTGYCILKNGGSAVDAVEGAVVVLENDPEFNAGEYARQPGNEPRADLPNP